MTDILIRRCTVRVVRRGGWSWGAEPGALLDAIRRWLPSLLAAELESALAGHKPQDIATPIQLRIPLSLSQLSAFVPAAASDGGVARSVSSGALDALRGAVRRAVAELFASRDPGVAEDADPVPVEPGPTLSTQAVTSGVSRAEPLRVLVDWLRAEQIRFRLAAFTTPALRAWHDRVLAAPPTPNSAPVPPNEAIEQLIGQARRAVLGPPDPDPDRAALTARLLVLAALESAAPGTVLHVTVRAALDRLLPDARGAGAPARPYAVPDAPAVAPDAMLSPGLAGEPHAPRQTAPGSRSRVTEWRVDSALPLLLLGPLARIGWLDAAAAALDAADASSALPLLGVALAHKVLPPPGRGWLRMSSAALSATAPALLPAAPPDQALHGLARAAAEHLSALNAVIADTLCEGHRAGAPLLLTPAAPGLLLCDLDGLFPIAVAADVAGLTATLRRLLHDIVLVAAAVATPGVLAALDALGVRFVTDAPPCRGEAWRRLPRRERAGLEMWTNDPHAEAGGFAEVLTDAPELAGASWQAIAHDRPAIARGVDRDFETALGLAASLALGSMAWELWRERETVAPDLALARFADLDGLVRADAASVTVRLPLGRRFFDLRDHGFLAELHGVPWFGGRVLRFDSG